MQIIFMLCIYVGLMEVSYAQVVTMKDTSKSFGAFHAPQRTDIFTDEIDYPGYVYSSNSRNQLLEIRCWDDVPLTKDNADDESASAYGEYHFTVTIKLQSEIYSPPSFTPARIKYRIDNRPVLEADAGYGRIAGGYESNVNIYSTKDQVFGNRFVTDALTAKKLIFVVSALGVEFDSGEFDLSGLREALSYGNLATCLSRR